MPYLKAFTTFTREGDRDRVRRKHTGASHCLNLNSIIVLPVSSSMPLLTFKSGAIIIIATDSLDYVTRKMSGRRRRQRLAGRRSGSQVELDFMARGHYGVLDLKIQLGPFFRFSDQTLISLESHRTTLRITREIRISKGIDSFILECCNS